ncbi:MAG: leucine-rich repeat domain-containing protein [Limisphaerales bacterium]
MLLLFSNILQAQFTFATNADNTITITGYSGSDDSLIIPNTANGLPVTSIGGAAFSSSGFTNVFIPNSVTTIQPNAFANCTNLAIVIIPGSVISLGDTTFSGCIGLTSVIISNGVTSIGEYAFAYCTALTNVNMANGVGSLGRGAFYYCTGLTDVVISGSVTDIADYTFQSCTSLASAVIPNSVTNLGSYAFEECASLKSFTVPNGVLNIGGNAFQYCTELTNIILADTVTSIGDGAFQNCSSLASVNIPNSVSVMGGYVFNACTSLASATISSNLPVIGDQMFAYCHNLTNVVIPDGVVSIGDYAFLFSGLTSVALPKSVTNIGTSTFYGCTNLKSFNVDTSNAFYSSVGGVLYDKSQTLLIKLPEAIVGSYLIPNGVTSIGNNAFGSCPSLTNVIIPASLADIGYLPFYYSSSLNEITVNTNNPLFSSADGILFDKSRNVLIECPQGKVGSYKISNTVTSIWVYAFYNCVRLTDVIIPNSVTSIGYDAFAHCTSLTNVAIPSSIWAISDQMFENCRSLASITIPTNINYIGYAAFSTCTNLQAVYFNGRPPSFGSWVFFGDDHVVLYFLPEFTSGWIPNPSFATWLPQMQTNGVGFGVHTNQFGFNINWASGQTIVVEACTNLINPVWQTVQTNTLATGSAYFSDPQWTNNSSRFYRLRSP